MFNYKKIRKLEKIIKHQEEVINRQAILMPVFKRLTKILEEYEEQLYRTIENECNYIHAMMKTTIGMVQKDRLKLIQNIKNETTKVGAFYINNILKEKDFTCEEPTKQ